MPKLKDLQEQVINLQHKIAVWESVAADLDTNFVSKDEQRAPKALRAPGCLVDRVSEAVIEDVIKTIVEGPIAELKEELQKVENQELKPAGDSNG